MINKNKSTDKINELSVPVKETIEYFEEMDEEETKYNNKPTSQILTLIIIILIYIVTFMHALNLTLHDYDDPSVDHISDAEIINDVLIVTGLFGGIDFYDISNPEELNHLRNFSLNNNGGGGNSKPNCVRAVGNYAYITAKNGVAVVDISNPSNPQYIRYLNNSSGYNLENLDIYGTLLAVTAHEECVLFYNISICVSVVY